MKKTTREYAEKLASEIDLKGSDYYAECQRENGFIRGYLKAIEENAVPELIEVAELALSHLVYSHNQKPFAFPKGENSIEKLRKVLNKINQ